MAVDEQTNARLTGGESESPSEERTIVLRHVPEELYQALEKRAATERLSVADSCWTSWPAGGSWSACNRARASS